MDIESLATESSFSVTMMKKKRKEKVGVAFIKKEDGIEVSSITPGTVAAETNLKKGDKVIAINGESIQNLSARGAADKIRGSKGVIEILAEPGDPFVAASMEPTTTTTITITIFGATGKVGKEFFKYALAENKYKLRVFVRNMSSYEEYGDNENVQIIEGDATLADDVDKAVAGAQIVTSFLGNTNGALIMTKATEAILSAAGKAAKPPRCIMISSIGVGGSSAVIGGVLQMIGGKEGKSDYEAAELLVREEKTVPCIIVRPYSLVDKEESGWKLITGNATFAWPISRKDVAQCFLDMVGEKGDEYVGEAVNIGG